MTILILHAGTTSERRLGCLVPMRSVDDCHDIRDASLSVEDFLPHWWRADLADIPNHRMNSKHT